MTADGRKGLELSWNLLNLADSAAMHGSSLTYAWLSDGTKVSAKADDGSGNGVVKRYLGSFVFTTSGGHSTEDPASVESIAWDEGRIFFEIPEAVPEEYIEDPDPEIDPDEPEEIVGWLPYRDCWFTGDHLGNVRTVIDITPDLSAPEILEQSDYLPFGTRIQNPDFISGMNNRWRYAGKEEQRFGLAGAFSPIENAPFSGTGFLDLSLLDFGARMYDPFTARWTAADPLAKACVPISPFVYCASNPIIVRDSDGNIIETVLDAASLAMGVKSFVSNVKQGNVGAAIVDGIGILADAAAVATPFVPGGVGAGIKAIRAGSKVADAVQGADRAADAAKAVDHAIAGVKSESKISGLKNAERIAAGRQFEKESVAAAKASGADVVSGVRVVPQNGVGNKVGNRSSVDQLIRTNNNTYQIVETKLTPKSGLSHGQRVVQEHVSKGSGIMEVRSSVPEFNLRPGDQIKVDNYHVQYKYP